jgi:hypothetical protein
MLSFDAEALMQQHSWRPNALRAPRRLLAMVLCAVTFGCANPSAFQFLGTAHYDGKKFLDLEGQFEAIALSPSGERVAFRGRDSMNAFALFVADVDGLTRRVASTGASDGLVTWSADGSTLYYLDSVPRPDGMLDGATIQRLTLSTGTVHQAVYAVPLLTFAPSPDGSRLLVGGASNLERLTLDETRNRIHEVGDGTFQSVAPHHRTVGGAWAVVWSPDGSHVALAPPTGESPDGAVSAVILKAPDWPARQADSKPFLGRYTAMAWEDAAVLRVVEIALGDFVTLTRLGTEGQVLEVSQHALDTPPAGTRYHYSRPVLSRDGRRALITRQVSDVETGIPKGPRQHFVFEAGTLRPLTTVEDLEPIGWSTDRRVLFLNGFYQRRRPVLIDVASAAP